MRKKEKEIVDEGKIEEILKRGKILHLAMSDGLQPYVLPLTYGYEEGKVFIHCAREGMKLDILRKNNRVCFSVDLDHVLVDAEKACSTSTKYRSVIAFGAAHIIDDKDGIVHGLSILMRHQFGPGSYEFSADAVMKSLVVRVDIESITGKKSGYD